MERKSNSIDSVSTASRLKYLIQLVRMNAEREAPSAKDIVSGIGEASDTYERYSGRPSSEAKFLEIGFGARPHRAFAFQARVKNVTAVDLDAPIFGPRDFPKSLRANGLYRAFKGVVRATLFDRGEWKNFHQEMREILPGYDASLTKLVVNDVGSDKFWQNNPGPYDFVFSTDVFEHIPPEILAETLQHLHANLAPNGVIVTRPMIFTGIVGGHDPYWYTPRVGTNSSETAWSHLWDPNFSVDTYLNRLTRADYDRMFREAGFRVLSDVEMLGRIGEEHLTEEIRDRLDNKFEDRELFSNLVEYVLCRDDAEL